MKQKKKISTIIRTISIHNKSFLISIKFEDAIACMLRSVLEAVLKLQTFMMG